MSKIEDFVLLNTIENMTFAKLKSLLDVFEDASNILKAGRKELTRAGGIDDAFAEKIVRLDRGFASAEMRLVEESMARVVTVFDEEYPAALKAIYSPPIVIYCKGRMLPSDADAIAVVGSRMPSHYGLSVCGRISSELASLGVTIVSGMARGIDTAAHRGALKANGRTIAVLGSGLGWVYPAENKTLAEEISEHGCVISEFPMDTPPNRFNFPRRNRLISGLSLGVVVVEASEKSGSLITADFALEENKEVFAVPGEAGSKTSAGTNSLIKQGAILAENAQDILDEMGPGLKFSKRASPSPRGPVLTEDEKNIRDLLGGGPMYIDDIAGKSRLDMARVGTLLLGLQLKNVIKELPGKNFVIK